MTRGGSSAHRTGPGPVPVLPWLLNTVRARVCVCAVTVVVSGYTHGYTVYPCVYRYVLYGMNLVCPRHVVRSCFSKILYIIYIYDNLRTSRVPSRPLAALSPSRAAVRASRRLRRRQARAPGPRPRRSSPILHPRAVCAAQAHASLRPPSPTSASPSSAPPKLRVASWTRSSVTAPARCTTRGASSAASSSSCSCGSLGPGTRALSMASRWHRHRRLFRARPRSAPRRPPPTSPRLDGCAITSRSTSRRAAP